MLKVKKKINKLEKLFSMATSTGFEPVTLA